VTRIGPPLSPLHVFEVASCSATSRRQPSYTTEISEVPSTTHPLGIRPAGEGGTTPALGVVINAIVDALAEFGVEHIEMPATPERIWRAMRGKPQRSRMVPDELERQAFGGGGG
jgi:hypothetical protein